jgi:hypothetical protein
VVKVATSHSERPELERGNGIVGGLGNYEDGPGKPSYWDGQSQSAHWWLEDLGGDPETSELDFEAPEAREEFHPKLADQAKRSCRPVLNA